jgi:hypothetical protein
MAIVDITCENDADFVRAFIYRDVNGLPIDLGGNTMRMGLRVNATDATETLLLTTENGGLTITSPPSGEFTLLITYEQLQQIPLGDYVHSLIRIYEDQHLRIWSGTLTNNAGPSRGTNT